VVDGVHPDRFNYADAALMERTPAGGIERLERLAAALTPTARSRPPAHGR
jgi:hypothetical protein